MSTIYRGTASGKRRFASGGMESIPSGAHMIPVEIKKEYDALPFHVYHPSPHDAITILRNTENQHDWLVCGWYVGTFRKGGEVKGLIYRQVTSEPDKEFVLAELKKHDKDGLARFGL